MTKGKFVPIIKKKKKSNLICRINEEKISVLKELSVKHKIKLSELIRQMLDFAIENM